ncbi:response regulator [Paenibacillus protaetiae]|uniref:Response regulator n=1 Tax=Paenibacillus protaetiae TaxID=2509456 RepID=A0A4P6EQY6_9BACL|nr:response regulator [Paenibacillus protaetiae]QAY65262.1 response regulator [Paenibacillus protaetiae]
MFRLLVVDDETIIADGLSEILQNTAALELDVYKAYSGLEAVKLFDRTRFDIVLTDIRMPEMDGLQLLEQIRKRWPECKVIFLTGFNEFSYVYSAIQYEGVSYLLKTEGYDKIISKVEAAVAEIETGLKAESLLQKAQEQLAAMQGLLQNDYVLRVLKEQLDREEINQAQLNELSIPLRADKPVLIMLGRTAASSKPYSEKSKQLYTIRLIAEQYLASHVSMTAAVNENRDIVWLIQPRAEEEAESFERALTFVKGSVELVQAACRESAGETVSFVLDDSPAAWPHIAERFATLNMLMNYRIGHGCGMLLLDKQLMDSGLQPSGTAKEQPPHMLRQSRLAMLADQLEHGQREAFYRNLHESAQSLQRITGMHDMQAQQFYYSVGLIYFSYMNRWQLVEPLAAQISMHKLMQPGEHGSWNSAFEYLEHVGEVLFNMQNQEEERRANAVITIIQKHIQDHLHNPDELSLVRLAELVYFNPSYLSRLFKQMTGVNLSEYITSCRMQKAKRLLEQPDIKIQDVAERVGYGTATNFTRSFRKLLHMTPQEYRTSALNK